MCSFILLSKFFALFSLSFLPLPRLFSHFLLILPLVLLLFPMAISVVLRFVCKFYFKFCLLRRFLFYSYFPSNCGLFSQVCVSARMCTWECVREYVWLSMRLYVYLGLVVVCWGSTQCACCFLRFSFGCKNTLHTLTHTHMHSDTFATLPECCLCFDCVFALHIMSIMSLAVPNTKSDSIEN